MLLFVSLDESDFFLVDVACASSGVGPANVDGISGGGTSSLLLSILLSSPISVLLVIFLFPLSSGAAGAILFVFSLLESLVVDLDLLLLVNEDVSVLDTVAAVVGVLLLMEDDPQPLFLPVKVDY